MINFIFNFFKPFYSKIKISRRKENIKIFNFYRIYISISLPIHFMKSFDGIISYSFLVFIVNKEHIIYEHWALGMTFLYYGGIILPYTLFSTGKNTIIKIQ